ncbi:hypothetical protein B0J17DRAFT_720450 [Rhizoctonia solani]|nr:hypothetical protein B0J17DRAFT_720450 [Rhizoctonia solani]
MAPIISPKILSQIMMYGCAVELSKASYVKLPYADLKARPVAICMPTVLVLGSVKPRQRIALAPCSNKASYTSLPNSTFVINHKDTCSEACLMSEEGSLVSVPETASFSTVDPASSGPEQMERVAPDSMESLEVCGETGSMETRVSSLPSTAPSASSITSCESPSTIATSTPPWEASNPLQDLLQRFGAPPAADIRSYSPVDSLDIIRHRRASEATGAGPSTAFTPRTRKFSDVRGLKGLGLRGLEILKKVKWST